MKFVVGLGNPGKAYQSSPHNVGFEVVDRLAERLGPGGSRPFRKAFQAEILELALEKDRLCLVKPLTFMNLSGNAVQSILGYFRGSESDVLVVHDDIDLPLGKLRFRAQGSSGGHKGLESIIQALKTPELQRLKIGVGRPLAESGDRVDAAGYVLAPFSAGDRELAEQAIERAANAVELWIRDGIEKSAQCVNGI
jgi:PTH1 family peptidyl-tRNA hydrolase